MRSFWQALKHAFAAWSADYAPSMGAALAYYTLFSIAPLLLIVISVAGLVFGPDAARGEIMGQLSGLVGSESAKAIEALLQSVNKPAHGVVGTVVGVALLLVGATTVLAELQDAMDRIWHCPAPPAGGGAWRWLRARILSLGLVLGIGFLLMVSLVFSAVLSALQKLWAPWPISAWLDLASLIDFAFNFVVLTAVVAMIYKWLPRVRLGWRDVIVGAAMTALMFTLGKMLIGLYIGRSGIATTFGAAASLVVFLVWVYYSAQIFLLGAEFTRSYAHVRGRDPTPLPAAG